MHLNKSFPKPKPKQPLNLSTEALSEYVFGKVPPQAVPLEKAVLGALMLDRDALHLVGDFLRPYHFYLESHQSIYSAILRLSERSQPVDLLTVTEEMRKAGELEQVAGGYYLVELSNQVASAANIEYHARILGQKYVSRAIIQAGTTMVRDAYEDTVDPLALLAESEMSLMGIESGQNKVAAQTMGEFMMAAAKSADRARSKGGLIGVPSGLRAWDNLTGGFHAGELTILAGRPGMGKTALVLTVAKNAFLSGKKVALFSLEMPGEQLAQRLVSAETGIPLKGLRAGHVDGVPLTDAQLLAAQTVAAKFSDTGLMVDDTPGLTSFDLRAKCRRMKSKYGLHLVIVDYLQLMSGLSKGFGNREQEIAEISRSLKGMAKELDVPVIALSQLSRAVESRAGSKRPILSDLRESGAIEQDADVVAFIYRPEAYNILQDESGNSTAGMAEIIIAKHRQGEIDTADVQFVPQSACFCDIGAAPKPVSVQTFPVYDPTAPIRRMPEEDIPF